MFWNKLVKNYLHFGRQDRIGAAVLLTVVAICVAGPRLIWGSPKPLLIKDDSVLAKAIDTLQTRQLATRKYRQDGANYPPNSYQQNNYQYEGSQKAAFTNGALFEFDPNMATAADWQRLGLNEKTSKTIEKYVSKGGKFYQPEDLQKIWGMPQGFYERVKDYVSIASARRQYNNTSYENKPFVREERKPITLDVNAADTAGFIALPGIGGKLSARIVNYRNKLGGFYSVEQVGETYGVPDSTFQKIKGRLQVDAAAVKTMNVNTATKDELKVHPYIKWNLANAIVEYRTQHGPFKNLEELKNIVLVDEATFGKISHYLSL